jgi:leucyl aminopeptidase (aminopeptidase T)
MKELLDKAVDKVLSDCLNLRRHEIALILCDSAGFEIGNLFYEALVQRCKETVLTIIPVRKEDGDELPEPVMMLLKRFDVAVIITEKQLPSSSIKSALSQCGVRTAIMSGVNSEILSRTAQADWRKLGVYTRRIAAQLSASKKITVVSGNSTELTINKAEIAASVDDGRLSSPGAIGYVPAGEVSIPLAGCSCNGTVSINGSFLSSGELLHEPLIIEIQEGMIKKIHNHPNAAFLEKKLSMFKQARILSEFGVGTLDTAIVSGNLVEDRKAAGSIHITFGNPMITKQNFSAVGVIVNADVKLDDKVWIRDGGTVV